MITQHDREEQAQVLADFLPNDATFEAKNVIDSELRNFLRGFAGEMVICEGYLKTLNDDYLPDSIQPTYRSEWEIEVGIPDPCFTGTGIDTERRRDILVKLSSSGLQTNQDYVDLAEVYGLAVTVTPGIQEQAFVEANTDYIGSTNADLRQVLVIDLPAISTGENLPWILPVIFGTLDQATLQCLYDRLKPSDTQVLFRSN